MIVLHNNGGKSLTFLFAVCMHSGKFIFIIFALISLQQELLRSVLAGNDSTKGGMTNVAQLESLYSMLKILRKVFTLPSSDKTLLSENYIVFLSMNATWSSPGQSFEIAYEVSVITSVRAMLILQLSPLPQLHHPPPLPPSLKPVIYPIGNSFAPQKLVKVFAISSITFQSSRWPSSRQ